MLLNSGGDYLSRWHLQQFFSVIIIYVRPVKSLAFQCPLTLSRKTVDMSRIYESPPHFVYILCALHIISGLYAVSRALGLG